MSVSARSQACAYLCGDDIFSEPWLKTQGGRGSRAEMKPLEITRVLLLRVKAPPPRLCSRAWARWWQRGQPPAERDLGLGFSRFSSILRSLEVTGIPEAAGAGAQKLPVVRIFTGMGRSEDVQCS